MEGDILMDDRPLVSIITVTLNIIDNDRKEYLDKCVESVRSQSYPNMEYIIQDGESCDGTLELLSCYTGLQVFSEPDGGIDEAYNNAMKHAHGKYVMFLNSDDYFHDDTVVERCVALMEEKKADYLYGKADIIDEKRKVVGTFVPRMENFWRDMPYSHQAFFIRRDVLEKEGNYDASFGIGGDYDLAIRLILRDYKGVYMDEKISYYRLGGISSQMKDKQSHQKTLCILASIMLKFYSLFYKDMELEDCLDIYHFGEKTSAVYPRHFLQKLINFMVGLDLKNFDYNKFIDYVNMLSSVNCMDDVKKEKIYLFHFLLIMKIKYTSSRRKYYLFGGIPLFKVTF